jgi:hypothetical protein
MAVDLTKNPWIIPFGDAGATVLSSDRLRIEKFRWIGGTTAGHTCVVQDAAGRKVWDSVATGANFVDDSTFLTPNFNVKGLIVPTMASGILEIYLR